MIYSLTDGEAVDEENVHAVGSCCVLLDFRTAFSFSNFSFVGNLGSYIIVTAVIFSPSEIVEGV